MCGILGVVAKHGHAVDWSAVRRASDRIRHRGPDGEGYLGFDAVTGRVRAMAGATTDPSLGLPGLESVTPIDHLALAHRRLAIIDLSSGGHQPMGSSDERYWIVFNGEIYNYLELRAELQRAGHAFRTQSDTEVLLASYAHWGRHMLRRLTGMFAFAILDAHERTIFLARDFFGIKPLYYHDGHLGFAFASEIKALLQLPGISRRADAARTYQFLRFGERTGGPETLYSDVLALPAAHYMVVSAADGDVLECQRYWDPSGTAPVAMRFDAAVAEFKERLRDSVRLHMRSDVAVGACLSGGLDSSALVSLMNRELAFGQQLHTFSYINEDPRFSEEQWIDLIAATQRHKVRPTASEFAVDVNELIDAQEVPFISLSVYAQFRVFRLAQETGVKVVIDGQGSDEILGGYSSLMGARLTSLLARRRYAEALRLLRTLPATTPMLRARTAASAAGRLLPQWAQLQLVNTLDGGLFPRWIERRWFAARGVRPSIRPHGRGLDAFREELLLGVRDLTLPQLLRYEDRNSMHFSIESRVPFCDPSLFEFALSLDPDYLVNAAGETKRVLRHAMRGIVPDPILTREKFGFPAPERAWLRTVPDFVAHTLGRESEERAPFLNMAEVTRMTGNALTSEGYWPPTVWAVLGLLAWARRFDVYWD